MLNTVNPIMTGIRMIFITFDISIYYLLILMYELFFNIATFNIMDRELIYSLFSRIQLVVGIFMMFRLVMIIINGIVNPDTVSDSKTGGAGSMVMRVIVSLALLALIVPINIPSPRNEYERQINNNGILFGTLYSLQYRVLANNTIGKIIMGDEGSNYTTANPDNDSLSVFANRFGATMIKIFYTLNTDENGNYVCGDGWDEEFYNQPHEEIPFQALEIIAAGARQCNENVVTTVAKPVVIGGQYSLSMTYVISTIAGIVLVVLMFMMTFEVAKRVFQLAALQLLAPIPIISYMDPKGSKDGAFQSWLKLLGTTYADLFVRLAVIYFAFTIINSFIVRFFTNSFSLEAGAEYVGNVASADFINAPIILSWTFIIMVIALFIFAKDAPKFLKQMLGIKGDGKFFSAFGSAMGLGVAAAGALGSFNANRQASRDATFADAKERARQRLNAANQRRIANGQKGFSEAAINKKAEAYANRVADSAGARTRGLASGLFGAGAGLITGSAAASESKGNAMAKMMAATNAMDARNRKVRDAGTYGAGLLSGLEATGQKIVRGESAHQNREARLKRDEEANKNAQIALKAREDALKTSQSSNALRDACDKRAMDKAKENEHTIGSYTSVSGDTQLAGVNWRTYESARIAANSGSGVHYEFVNKNNPNDIISKADYERLTVTEQRDYKDMSYFEVDGSIAIYANANNPNDIITQEDYNKLSAAQQSQYSGISSKAQKVYMKDAEDVATGLLKENAADLYDQSVIFENNGASRTHDDGILTNRRIYVQTTGTTMEDTYKDVKDASGNVISVGIKNAYAGDKEKQDIEATDIKKEAERISTESTRITNEKNTYQAMRDAKSDSYLGKKNG